MKTLLLTAKYLAKQENSNEIKIKHIKNALRSLEFNDSNIENEIYKYLKIVSKTKENLVTKENLDDISKIDQINYGPKTKNFISFLKEKDFSTKTILTYIYYPPEKINYTENANQLISLGSIKEKLKGVVFDQDIAIESVKDVISRAIFEQKEDSVKAILFFVGPPATGKTYLSEETGKLLKAFNFSTKIFNMTMYSEESSNLTGLAQPMAGAGKGDLSKFIKENPTSLIIFDEIEKCHLQKQLDLFRLLDRGYIEDKFDNSIIDATQCILIFTSNLGKSIYTRNDYTSMIENQKETESLMLDVISNERNDKDELILTPPLTSRLSASKIVLFNQVGLKAYFNMSKNEIERYFDVIQNKFGLKMKCSDEAILASFLRYLPFFDPRRVKGKIGDDLFDAIRDHIQTNSIDISQFKTISITVDSEVELFLSKNFIKDIKTLNFNDDRFRELIDKKETLNLKFKISNTKTILKLKLTSATIQKIKNINDFSGDVKIELDIPSGKIEGEPKEKIFGHVEAKKMLVRISTKIQKFQELQRQNNPKSKDVLKNIPKGILLYGPPGTGKTKLARAFAAQVECPIIVSSGKDMTTMQYVGTGVAKIKEIFKKAREYAPSVLFIDEIDAIGTRGSNQSNNDTNINTLLEELDGFNNDVYKPVFVIAATNRKDNIDPAIIRAGRIEEHIHIDTLTKDARLEFIQDIFTSDNDFSKEIDTHKFLKYTVSMSGAQMEMVFKKAKYKLDILREDENNYSLQVDLDFLIEVVNEIKYGFVNKNRIDAKFENMLTAYHEAGHAIVSLALNQNVPIEQITITPRSDFGGFVSYNHEDVHRLDKQFYIGKIASAYAGRIAEELYFSNTNQSASLGISSGASSDITQATNLIKNAVLKLGMDSELGLINYDELDTSEATKVKIDNIILQWQNNIKALCKKVLKENWYNVELIVKELIGDENTDPNETLDSQWLDENIFIEFDNEII